MCIRDRAQGLWVNVEKSMNALQFSNALTEIWKLIGECNRYIDLTTPWVLAKNEADRPRLGTVLYVLLECARIVAVLIAPTMPRTPERIFAQIGVTDETLKTWASVKVFGGVVPGSKVHKGEALFPRIDVAKELELLEAEKQAALDHAKEMAEKDAKQNELPAPADEEKTVFTQRDLIQFEDFEKVQLVVAKVLKCEKVPKADKLLMSTLKVGDTERVVVSGCLLYTSPAQPALLTIGRVEAGHQRNILAEEAKMEGIIRTFSNAIYAKLEEKILQNMASVDAAFGTKTEMFKRVFYPCVENDPAEVERVRALLGDRFVTEKPRMIAEDFAYYQLNVPGGFVFCGCMDEEHRSPLHADTFDFDERALITGLALFIGLTARKDKENGLV